MHLFYAIIRESFSTENAFRFFASQMSNLTRFIQAPFDRVLKFAGIVAFVVWALSLVTDNYTFMDRLWPILPAVYSWIIVDPFPPDLSDPRLVLMAAVLTFWGLRLFAYFYIKGVYNFSAYDDYRWISIKNGMSPMRFQLFNLFFIAIFQNILLVLMILPVHYVSINRESDPLNFFDCIICLSILLSVIGEGAADWQQWNFQQKKKKDKKLDFISTGLFRFCRHPNYFCDIMVYLLLYFFSIKNGFYSLD
ncbi:hypothetical protein MHBO_000495 [Bonamia ostreae]|uniref:Steroid 5-alpha reductase C-terminal domain-containing protein n=1 Tax=Bonamia ostreae TaxID=126728 RepID=A0ABV2AFV0_9EUKA